jgi:galactose-1-phosphate uridylyltransferase
MKKLRKVNTRKRKQARKEAQDSLDAKTSMFLDHPKECCLCSTPFERTQETVKTWQVTVRENRVRLTCPTCSKTLAAALEKLNGKD